MTWIRNTGVDVESLAGLQESCRFSRLWREPLERVVRGPIANATYSLRESEIAKLKHPMAILLATDMTFFHHYARTVRAPTSHAPTNCAIKWNGFDRFMAGPNEHVAEGLRMSRCSPTKSHLFL